MPLSFVSLVIEFFWGPFLRFVSPYLSISLAARRLGQVLKWLMAHKGDPNQRDSAGGWWMVGKKKNGKRPQSVWEDNVDDDDDEQ